MVGFNNQLEDGGPHLPLYVLQEIIGIQRGKGETNIWFGRLTPTPKNVGTLI
jgi:hypothetical protein